MSIQESAEVLRVEAKGKETYSITSSYIPLGSRESAMVLATSTASMTGTAYVSVSVNSNMITASETVVRVTPDNVAAAPTIAYSPGMTHWEFGLHDENICAAGQRQCAYCTASPTM